MSDQQPIAGLSHNFALLIDGLWRMLWTRKAAHLALGPLLLLILNRLRRTVARFASLAARVQAGTLKPPRPRNTARPRRNLRHPASRTGCPKNTPG